MGDRIQKAQAEAEQPEVVYDSSDPKQVNNARKKAALEYANDLRVLEALMDQQEIRRYLFKFLSRCHIYATPADCDNIYRNYFRQGEENIGKQLMLDIIAAAPENYLKMLDENKSQ